MQLLIFVVFPNYQSPIILVNGLENLVNLFVVLTGESVIYATKGPDVLVICLVYEFQRNFVIWLNLKHFQEEAKESGRFVQGSINATYIFYVFVDSLEKGFSGQGETPLLKVRIIVYFQPGHLIYKKLRVCAVYLFCSWVCTIRHYFNSKKYLMKKF